MFLNPLRSDQYGNFPYNCNKKSVKQIKVMGFKKIIIYL